MNNAIYSDDPQATQKLREKIAGLEAKQEGMRKGNLLVRGAMRKQINAESTPELIDHYLVEPFKRLGFQVNDAAARLLLKPDFAGRYGFPDYELKNNSANIRRLKQRLAQLEKGVDARL